MGMQNGPMARSAGLSSEWVDGELVIYDEVSQIAHCLSSDAARVFEQCDGEHSEAEIAISLGIDRDTVLRALDQLTESELLDQAAGYSRRQAAKHIAKVGGAAFVAPLIYSVAIPAAAAAFSCPAGQTVCSTPTNACCTSTQKCCSTGCVACTPTTKSCPGATCSGGGNCCSGTCTGGFCT
jgi:hypothetical protein